MRITPQQLDHTDAALAAKIYVVQRAALALYTKLGFVEVQRCFVGPERLELVALEKVCSIELDKRTGQRLNTN